MTTDAVIECAHLEALSYLKQLPRVLGVRCECGAWVRRERKARVVRERTDAEREAQAARDEARCLSDLACVARWRLHVQRARGGLAAAQGTVATTDPDDAKGARVAPATDVDHERDLARGRTLDRLLRALAADAAPDDRSLAVLAWLVERGRQARVAVVGGRASETDPLAQRVGVAFAAPKALAAWRASRDLAGRATEHGRPLLAAAVALWALARMWSSENC